MGKMSRSLVRRQVLQADREWYKREDARASGHRLRAEDTATLRLQSYELYEEPTIVHGKKCDRLNDQAVEALHAGRFRDAENLLERALALESGGIDLKNNLGAAWAGQGRTSEAIALYETLMQEHPDYVFAVLGLAGIYYQQDELDATQALLDRILSQRRIHHNAFAQTLNLQILVLLEQGRTEAALSWIRVLVDSCSEYRVTAKWEKLLDQAEEVAWRALLEVS